jgi:hypothetical protein
MPVFFHRKTLEGPQENSFAGITIPRLNQRSRACAAHGSYDRNILDFQRHLSFAGVILHITEPKQDMMGGSKNVITVVPSGTAKTYPFHLLCGKLRVGMHLWWIVVERTLGSEEEERDVQLRNLQVETSYQATDKRALELAINQTRQRKKHQDVLNSIRDSNMDAGVMLAKNIDPAFASSAFEQESAFYRDDSSNARAYNQHATSSTFANPLVNKKNTYLRHEPYVTETAEPPPYNHYNTFPERGISNGKYYYFGQILQHHTCMDEPEKWTSKMSNLLYPNQQSLENQHGELQNAPLIMIGLCPNPRLG